MVNESTSSSLIPQPPVPDEAWDFAERVHRLMDGRVKDEATVARALEGMDAMFNHMAAKLYTLASMLVGEGEESVALVETAIANVDAASCKDPLEGGKNCRLALSTSAIEHLARREPGSLAVPASTAGVSTCIEDDDLDAAGEAGDHFERMIAGQGRDRVRNWLAALPADLRTVFALRAVAGFSSDETAALLAVHGGQGAQAWTPPAVRETFRQGLCSLATQLLHSTVGQTSGS